MQNRLVLHKFQTFVFGLLRKIDCFTIEAFRTFKVTFKIILLRVSYSSLGMPPHILNFMVKDLVGFPVCADKVPKDISLIDVTKVYVPPISKIGREIQDKTDRTLGLCFTNRSEN